jgi:AraC-like DNA-binding protein
MSAWTTDATRTTPRMFISFEDRPSDSPYIERVWRCQSNGGGHFLSVAAGHLELVVTRLYGLTTVTIRGPETRATTMDCPPNGHWFAIRFRLGVYMPQLPTHLLVDHHDVNLPVADDGSFWLEGFRWELPDFEHAEAFVARLARRGVIAQDPAVQAALLRNRQALTARSLQRHFRHATGITRGLFDQIERARHATNLLRAGCPIVDVVHEAGYFDQAHLSRSFKALIGQTPASVVRREAQLSFLYKTEPLP